MSPLAGFAVFMHADVKKRDAAAHFGCLVV
jgi:hypothetical protein